MARNFSLEYPGRTTTPDTDHPDGTFRDEVPSGSNNGTPLQEAWAVDLRGENEAAILEAGIDLNGQEESAVASQYLNAKKAIMPRGTIPRQASNKQLCGGFHGTQWFEPTAIPNAYESLLVILDSCIGWERSNGSMAADRPIIYTVTTDNEITPISGCWRYNTPPAQGTALSIVWPETVAGLYSICSDKEALYVVWAPTPLGSLGDNMQLSRIPIQGWASGAISWTRDLGFTGSDANGELSKCIVADDDNIAVIFPSLIASNGVVIVAKDNSSISTGTGNNATGTDGEIPFARIVSDGEHVFWFVRVLDSTNYVYHQCSARIDAPATSDYSSSTSIGNFATDSPEIWPADMVAISEGNIVVVTREGKFYVRNGTSFGPSMEVSNFSMSSLLGVDNEHGVVLGFDGLNVWAYLLNHVTGRDLTAAVLVKVPASEFAPYGTSSTHRSYQANIVRMDIATSIDELSAGKIFTDRQDLWLVLRTGDAYRVCNPGYR